MYQFAENIKSNKALFFYRGGMALYALLKAMDIGQGDQVLMQVFSCPAVPFPVVSLGAEPVYVDIDPTTFNLDPAKIEERITRKTRAIIVQHTFGIPAEMDPILDIAHKHNLRIIEDSCHAFGSRYKGQEVGTFGDAAIYSFGWYKPVVLGVGGAAVVNDPALKQKVAILHENFVTPPLKELVRLYPQYWAYALLLRPSLFWPIRKAYYMLFTRGLIAGTTKRKNANVAQDEKSNKVVPPKVVGKRMIPWQKKRLFRKIDRFVTRAIPHQALLVSQYDALFAQIGCKTLELGHHLEPVFYKYPVLFDRKKEIFENAPQAQVELSDMFMTPLYPAWQERRWRRLGYEKGMCPVSEDISDRIVAMPLHTKIGAREVERTFAFLASFQVIHTRNGIS